MRTTIPVTVTTLSIVILLLVLWANRHNNELNAGSAVPFKATSELKEDSEAQTLLAEVMAAMQKVTSEDGALPRPGWKKVENFEKLARIVEKYPGTESALTAKLLISHIYFDPDNPQKDLAKGKAIISEIQENFPGTWQATIAEMDEGGLLLVQKQWKAGARIWEKIFDKIGRLEKSQNTGYMEYKKLIQNDRDYDMRGSILDALVYAYCKIGDLEKAKEVCEHLVKEYPAYPRIEAARHDLRKLKAGVSPYYTPPKKTKEEIAEEIRKIDEE